MSVNPNSPFNDDAINEWATKPTSGLVEVQPAQPGPTEKDWEARWKKEGGWGKFETVKGEAMAAQTFSMITAPIVRSAITANCQTNNLKEQAFLAKQKAKQLDAKWSAVQGDEEAFSSDVQNDTSAALKLISTTQTNMAIQRAIFLRNYKNTQKIGMFLITLVFFALLIKWVFFGKNVDPFIPGLVGKKGKKRSTSRRKSKKKWWKF